jgi:raffinose/stachyose/melibiose transport system substrate-binding protein
MLDEVTQGGNSNSFNTLIKLFEAQHPNVSIDRTAYGYSNYRVHVKLVAASPNAPDIIEGDGGPGGVVSELLRAGLIIPLTHYASEYQWQSKYGALWRQLELSPDGLRVGTGTIYGIPDFAEIFGVFYNKTILSKLHMPVPATLSAFEATLAAAKKAGMIPDFIGGASQYPWSHLFDILADHYGSPKELTAWFNGVPGSTIVSPGMIKAGQVEQSWYHAGYFEPGANGYTDTQAINAFAHGQSLFKIDGPWSTQTVDQALGTTNAGWFLLAPLKAGTLPASTGWMGWELAISSKSKYPGLAAQFINLMTSESAQKICLSNGNPAGTPHPIAGVPVASAAASEANAYNAEVAAGTLVPYMDVAYPQAAPYNMLENSQAMAAGKITPLQFLQLSQTGWAKYHNYKQ